MIGFSKSPIMVIGMHRAGTSVVARLVSACKVWMGWDVDSNHESRFFQNTNKTILRKYGEYWHNCSKTLKTLADEQLLQDWADEVRHLVKRDIWVKYFGPGLLPYAAKSFLVRREQAWGWKDPRTTLLIPLWKRVYPNARVIAVLRNPRDTCISLYYRELERYKWKRRTGGRNFAFEFSLPRCFNVWKLYAKRTLLSVNRYPECSMLLKYESLKDRDSLQKLISFIGVRCDPMRLAAMISYGQSDYDDPPDLDQLEDTLTSDPFVAELGYR